MYLVAAFDLAGRPYGSTKVQTRDDAERTAERYMASGRVGSVAVRKLLPELVGRGNGQDR